MYLFSTSAHGSLVRRLGELSLRRGLQFPSERRIKVREAAQRLARNAQRAIFAIEFHEYPEACAVKRFRAMFGEDEARAHINLKGIYGIIYF